MPNFNLKEEYIDLNSSPADNDTGHLPVPSSENVPVITEEHNDVQPLRGPTLIENSREPLFPSMPGETSGPPPKRSSSKRPQDLPAGWMMEERVRHSGKSAGKTDKLMMLEMNLNKEFIDLNSTPVVDLPKKYDSYAALNSREPLFPSMPGETSGILAPKRSSSKRPQDLPPAGWMMEERVRHSGKSAGKTYKGFSSNL